MCGNSEVPKRVAANVHKVLLGGRVIQTNRIIRIGHLPFENLPDLFREGRKSGKQTLFVGEYSGAK